MSRPTLLLIALFLGVPACGTDQEPSPPPTSPEQEAPESPAETTEYLALPEVGRVALAGSCQSEGPDGPILNAELANGGSLQLRKLADGILHVSALPSPGADPVGTRVPSDTSWTEEGGVVSGSSVLWLEDTENRIVVEFRVRWDDSVAACPAPDADAAPLTGVPSPVIPEHGGTYWGVYLAAGDESEIEDALNYLSERGIEAVGGGSVECDEGAREALGPGAGALTVAVYFDTRLDAHAWAETLPAPPVVIAEVRTFCLD